MGTRSYARNFFLVPLIKWKILNIKIKTSVCCHDFDFNKNIKDGMLNDFSLK